MRVYRVIGDLLIVISTTLLIGIIAFDKLSHTDNRFLTNIFLQAMHLCLPIGVVLNAVHQLKSRQYIRLFFTFMPLIFFLIAVAGVFAAFQFPALLLLTFDFYLIYWFFSLFLNEFNR